MRIDAHRGPTSDESSPEPTTPAPTLRRGARGNEVKAAQEQLLRAGFSLPRYGADGQFGGETAAALARFQKTYGVPQTGRFDAATFEALARALPPAPDYDALFADGVLRGVVAIGFDEVGSHEAEQADLLKGLWDRGYRNVSDAERQTLGLDDGRYVTRTFTHEGREVRAVLEVITPDTEQAKDRFATALRQRELVLYGGHGRYGSGPDFDDIRSPAGNFVIGAPFEAGHVTLGPNDLAAQPLTRDYQLMFFDGCNTFRYLDDLRTKAKNKTTANLDVLGSTTELYWHVTADNLLAMLDGVTSGDDVEVIKESLDRVNRTGADDRRRYFTADGFEDNVRPR
ncbi:MAG: peptidoglycan-binding domain-containing protein [Myxococcota bacterium]